MREIKFRIWDKKKKKMFYASHDCAVVLLLEQPTVYGGCSDYSQEPEFKSLDWYNQETFNVLYVLMQYTGLKDKDGVKIYEGDVLEYVGHKCLECGQHFVYPNHKLYIVKWRSENAEFTCTNEDNYILSVCWDTNMIVKGNIHDNPELMENKK